MFSGSLRGRVTILAVATVAVVVLLVDLLLTFSVREEFEREIDRAMRARVALVEALEGDAASAEELVAQLSGRGVPAIVTAPGTDALATDVDGDGLPPEPHEVRRLILTDGTEVQVIVSRAGAERAQRRLLLTGVAGSALAVTGLLVLLTLFSDRVLRPLDVVVETAREIAAGRSDARLAPMRTDTEIGRLAVAFDEMLDAQDAAIATARSEEARSRRFLADAAHQLRTPVAGLRAATEALLHDPDTADRERLLAHLAREASRTSRLLDGLLRVAEQDRGDAPSLAPVDLTAMAREEVARQQPLAPNLRMEVVAPSSCELLADGDGMREALANLLDNARRHARSRIEVTVGRSSDRAGIRVEDDGPGLAPGTEEQVFERFASLDGRGGSGLGLPIAQATARALGGDLYWRDGGFDLVLPRRDPYPRVEDDGDSVSP
jgi:two-component system, OmpR family, sensor kinase